MIKNYSKLQNGSDVRGVASDALGKDVNLTAEAAMDIAYGFGVWLSDARGRRPQDMRVAVGRDSRLTGPALQAAVCSALNQMGYTVLDCGMASTPAMFMACVYEESACDGAVMITASHLPMDRNGLKFFEAAKGGLDKADISEILQTAAFGFRGSEEKQAVSPWISYPLMDLYCEEKKTQIRAFMGLTSEDKPLSGLKVCVDAGGGAGGFYATKILEPLGADIRSSQLLDPDGYFSGHAPNPEDADALASACAAGQRSGADLGLIFDTDVDRMAVVGSDGKAIARNGIVALAALLCPEGPAGEKGTIVTDSITSTQLADFLAAKGYTHLRYKRGYKNVINKGRELNEACIYCPLAIETSGHAALKENYFLDDGAYLATKVVARAALLKREGKFIQDLLKDLGEPSEAKEFRLPVLAEDFASYADEVLQGLEAAAASGDGPAAGMTLQQPNYEGVRVNVQIPAGPASQTNAITGWFLLRKSLHDPLMPLNIESDQVGGVAEIAGRVTQLLAPWDKLDLSKLK